MNQKAFSNISLAVIAVMIAVSGYFVFSKNRGTFPPYSITTDNTFSTNIDGYFETCIDTASIYKQVNRSWKKVSNELPRKGLYYLDDKFFGYGMCDVVYCTELPKPYTLKFVEYIKVGERVPPPDSGSTVNALPVYQAIALSSDIKIDIQYFSDKNCQNKKTVSSVIKKNEPAPGPITISGEITCLPKKGQGGTEECAIGLRGTDGRHYGLKNVYKLDPEYKFSKGGLRVEVSGIFNPEEIKGPDGNRYDAVGTIDVISIKKVAG